MKKLTNIEKIDKLNSFSDKNSFIVISKYSKSLLEFKYINNKIIVTIKYNKLKSALIVLYLPLFKNSLVDVSFVLSLTDPLFQSMA